MPNLFKPGGPFRPLFRKSVRKTFRGRLRVLSHEPTGPHAAAHSRRVYRHAEPLPLVIAGREAVVAYACGACGHVESVRFGGAAAAIQRATECCRWKDRCGGCGTPVHGGGRCSTCWSRDAFLRTRNSARKAKVVGDTGDPVCCEHFNGEWGDGYSSCLDAHLETWNDEHAPERRWVGTGPDGLGIWEQVDPNATTPPPPPFVFCTTPCVPEIDAASVFEQLLEDMHDGAQEDDLPGSDELQAAIDAFNGKQRAVSYMVDYSRVIVIDQARFEDYLASDHEGRPDVRYRRDGTGPVAAPAGHRRPATAEDLVNEGEQDWQDA